MSAKMRKRINITIPEETLDLIEQVGAANRSEFINRAVRMYAARLQRAQVKKRLRESYLARAEEDIELAAEWGHVSGETLALLDVEEAPKL